LIKGNIWVESEEHYGTTFYFTARFESAAECHPTTEPFTAGNASDTAQPLSLHILLAEDNPVNQKVAMRLLEKRGHVVTVAATGHEAVTAMSRHTFDLILMDVQMPEMGGFEATRIIRQKERSTGSHIPIIIPVSVS